MSAQTVLSVLSAILGFVAVLVSGGINVRERKSTKATAKVLEPVHLADALGADDIDALGALLVDDLGRVTISSFVTDDDVRVRFRNIMDGVIRYLDRPESEAPLDPGFTTEPIADVGRVVRNADLQESADEIMYGETWNGLARLRRVLEVELRRHIAAKSGDRFRSAGALVRLLTAQGVLDPPAAQNLAYAVGVANKGIHGEEVARDQALEALQVSDQVIFHLRRASPPSPAPDANVG